MARTWLVIDVELVSGGEHGDFWPRPGRTFVAARTHTFEEFAEAIDDAFGRWDLAHLHEFTLIDGTAVGTPDDEFRRRSGDPQLPSIQVEPPGLWRAVRIRLRLRRRRAELAAARPRRD